MRYSNTVTLCHTDILYDNTEHNNIILSINICSKACIRRIEKG